MHDDKNDAWCHEVDTDATGEGSRVHSEASLNLEILERWRDVQHKAQISSIMIIILSLLYSCVSVNKCIKVKDSES